MNEKNRRSDQREFHVRPQERNVNFSFDRSCILRKPKMLTQI